MKINTVKLQEMITQASKGSGNNKLIPITSMMLIELKQNKLTLVTTDATNYLYVTADNIEGEDMYVTILAEQFIKLISRMTCETVSLELNDSALVVKGNGTYNIEIPTDDNGEIIKYPNPIVDIELVEQFSLTRSKISRILETCKYALATTYENPCYTGYYVGTNVLATDTYKICRLEANLLDSPALISAQMMNLLEVFTQDKISVMRKDNTFVFFSEDCTLYGTAMEGIEDYAVDAINTLIETEFENTCKVPKSELLQALDRLSLFVNKYDNNVIQLVFNNSSIQLSSKASSGIEVLNYIESSTAKEFICSIDIEMFMSQIKAQASDTVTIGYGAPNAIKMIDNDVIQIVSLIED